MYLTYRWNVIYQYELNKIGQFHYLDLPNVFPWNYSARPFSENSKIVKIEDIDLKNYKAFVLHFNEMILNPGKNVRSDFGEVFRRLAKLPIKKVFVCHGVPALEGRFEPDFYFEDNLKIDQDAKIELENFIQDDLVIFPNLEAQSKWNFKNSLIIEPTLSYQHYPYVSKTKSKFVSVSPFLATNPQYSGYKIFDKVCLGLGVDVVGKDPIGIAKEITPPSIEGISDEKSIINFYDYLDFIGQYSCYLNTHVREPWHHNLYESMLLGSVPVTTNYFGESKVIKNGYNGFYSNNVYELRNYAIYLLANPERAIEMGYNARKTMLKKFSTNKFYEKWSKLLE
jgi:glycosyltransferase involved in cell wall biosynthesis